MKYKVWDIEDNKERIITDCVIKLGEAGSERRVNIKTSKGVLEPHTFRVLEVLPDDK